MSMPLSLPAVGRCLVLGLFCLLATPVLANSITIGSITFLSQGTWGNPRKSIVAIQLDTTGVTYDAYALGIPYPLTLNVNVFGWDTGAVVYDSVHRHARRSSALLPVRVSGICDDPAADRTIPPGQQAAV